MQAAILPRSLDKSNKGNETDGCVDRFDAVKEIYDWCHNMNVCIGC